MITAPPPGVRAAGGGALGQRGDDGLRRGIGRQAGGAGDARQQRPFRLARRAGAGDDRRLVRRLRQAERGAQLGQVYLVVLLGGQGQPRHGRGVGQRGAHQAQHGARLGVLDDGRDGAIGALGQQGAAGGGPFDLAPQPVLARLQRGDPAAGRGLAAVALRVVGGVVLIQRQGRRRQAGGDDGGGVGDAPRPAPVHRAELPRRDEPDPVGYRVARQGERGCGKEGERHGRRRWMRARSGHAPGGRGRGIQVGQRRVRVRA